MKSSSLLLTALLAVLPAIATAQNAPMSASLVEKDKGAVTAANAIELQGIITGIDKATREVTIRGGSGNELTITAGPQVKNFKQIKVGDLVTLSYIAALGLDLKKGGGRLRERIEGFKVPRHWWLAPKWPMTASGKTDHASLGRAVLGSLRQLGHGFADPALTPLNP